MRVQESDLWMVISKAIGVTVFTAVLVCMASASWGATWMARVNGLDTSGRVGGLVQNTDGSYRLIAKSGNYLEDTTSVTTINADGKPDQGKKYSGGSVTGFDKTSDGGLILVMVRQMPWPDPAKTVLAKIDANGILIWEYELDQDFRYVVVDGSYCYLAGGWDWAKTGNGVRVARFDLINQQLVWSKYIDTPESFLLENIRRDRDGGLLLVGYGGAINSGRILKVSSAGLVVAARQLTGANRYSLHDIMALTDGYVIVADTSEGPGDYHGWVAKLTTTWAIRWQKTVGGCGNESMERIALMNDGSLLVGGMSTSWETRIGDNGDTYDMWALNLSSSNTWKLNWQKRYWTVDREYVDNLAATSDGGMVLAGRYSPSFYEWGNPNYERGIPNTLLVKTDATGGVFTTNYCGTIACPAVTNTSATVATGAAGITSYTVTTVNLPTTLTPTLDTVVDLQPPPADRICH